MGHAYPKKISERLNRQLYAKGQVSIAEVCAACLKNKEYLTAGEGTYDEESDGASPMIRMALMEIVNYLSNYDHDLIVGGTLRNPKIKPCPVIVVHELTEEQQKVYDQWQDDEIGLWDCGDDGNGGEYGIFDSIKWKFAPGWRRMYPNIPVLDYICN